LEVQEALARKRKSAIELTTNTMDIPFELMRDERAFLCLSHPIGRHIEMMQAAKSVAPITAAGWRALVVGDPTGDLSAAQEEAEAVADLLAQRNVTVERLIGPEQATLKNFVSALVLQQYHLIHYAGHAFFNPVHPSLSGLRLTQDGHEAKLTAEELKRYLNSPAFVFFSACEAAAAERAATVFNAQGSLIQNLAVAALEGGACGCLGPMWEVADRTTKDFSMAFYSFLLQGKPTGEAVRLARTKLSRYSTDCWASWVLFGNPYTHPLGAAPMDTQT
jgi:CHAT domain-containing protein